MGVLAAAGAALIALVVTSRLGRPPPRRPPPDEPDTQGRHRQGRRVPGRWVALGVAALGAIGLFGVLPTTAIAIGLAGLRRSRHIRTRRTAHRAVGAAVPEAIDAFVLLVHAGLTPRLAVVELRRRGPMATRPAFGAVVDRIDRGEPFADALRALTAEIGPAATALVELVGSADRNGLPLAAALDQLAAETRAMRRRLDEAAARSLPVKLSFPLVVCTLPSFVLLAIAPAVMAALSSLGSDAW